MKLLHIDSSVLGPHSVSRQVSAAIVDRLRQSTPGLEVSYRDLTLAPLAHLTGSHLAAGQGAAPEAACRADIAAGQAVLEEFLAADIVVLGAPMYNFTIPSQLKAWIDRILVAGKTFKYCAQGVEGTGRQQARHRRDLARRILRPGHAGRGRRTSGNLSALGVRLHRHQGPGIHFRRRHPGRSRASRKSRGRRAESRGRSERRLA